MAIRHRHADDDETEARTAFCLAAVPGRLTQDDVFLRLGFDRRLPPGSCSGTGA